MAKIKRPSIVTHPILVEGPDDVFVLANLMEHHGMGFPKSPFWIDEKGGKDPLLASIESYLKQEYTHILVVVLDADSDPGVASRWDQVAQRLRDFGYNSVPSRCDVNGTIILEQGKPTVGIWIMPDNYNNGMLEDFVQQLIRIEDPLWPFVDPVLDSLPECPQRFSLIHKAKARVHTWLAWQEEPGKPLGLAIKARYLDADAPAGRALIEWFRRLLA